MTLSQKEKKYKVIAKYVLHKVRELMQEKVIGKSEKLWELWKLFPAWHHILLINVAMLININKWQIKTQLRTTMEMNEIDGNIEN